MTGEPKYFFFIGASEGEITENGAISPVFFPRVMYAGNAPEVTIIAGAGIKTVPAD